MDLNQLYYDTLAKKFLKTLDEGELKIMSIGMISKDKWDVFLKDAYSDGEILTPSQENDLAKAIYRNAKMVV